MTSWYDYPGAILGQTERPLLDCFANNVRAGETWLDVGAHYGYTAIALCKLVGASGRVFAFEPMLETADCAVKTGFLNNFSQMNVYPLALGNCTDVSVNSLHVLRGMLGAVFEGHSFNDTDFSYQFLSSRLEWLWPKIAGSDLHIDGIKIDVQGAEIEVLEGMASIAKRYQPKLLIEIHRGVSRPKLLDLLVSMGYSPRGAAVEPLSGETDPIYADDRTYLFTSASSQAISA
jgi:FkbM family methyltransferase